MGMYPDQVMSAIRFAEFVLAKKKDRIGSSEAMVYPMKFFFFHGQNEIMGLVGVPACGPEHDEKDILALMARLFAYALDAKAVLHVTEGWVAEQCAFCGSAVSEVRDGKCRICGNEPAPASQNPYGQEMLICTLSVRDHAKTFFWTSRFDRDEDGTIKGFADRMTCAPLEGSGRFMQVWALESWMGPHFAVNLPVVLKAVGRKVTDKAMQVAKVAQDLAPPDYPFVCLNLQDVGAAVNRMRIEQN